MSAPAECEIKTCELCGRLFVRATRPTYYDTRLGLWLGLPLQTDCAACIANPPRDAEEVVVVESRSYRVVGVKF